jgi:hypothetical protein
MGTPYVTLTLREKTARLLFIGSVVLVVFAILTNLLLEASEPMMAITFASCLFAILPIIAIISIQKNKSPLEYEYLSHNNEKKSNRATNNVRVMGLIFGLFMLLFTIGAAVTAYEIYEPDVPGGIILALSGFLAIAGAISYQREITPNIQQNNIPPPPPIHETEIIHEKEVIVKIRCRYCGITFDEKLDRCPTCGAGK